MSRALVVLPDLEAWPPIYPWRAAPPHLATRAQLRAMGLRPGRQDVQALVVWNSRRGGRPRCVVNRGYLPSRRTGMCNVCAAELGDL